MASPNTTSPQEFPYRLYPMGDAALVVSFGEVIDDDIFSRVQAFSRLLAEHPFRGFVEQVPAYTTVTIFYNPRLVDSTDEPTAYQNVARQIEQLLRNLPLESQLTTNTSTMLPVCYGGVFGPDLEFVAQTNSLTAEEVIALHSGQDYLVYMIGFAPGFPYLGGMNEKIAAPRKSTPRAVIPVGSVGIAGNQTGVYSLETPGGWQLIGRTPVALFRPHHQKPCLLKAGDVVQFYPITEAEFKEWKEEEHEFKGD